MEDSYIEREMRRLCKERDLIPLAGIERGSRMIGVAHDDSDWDAFLLFRQTPADYIKLGGYTDTISAKLDSDDLDIHGWNIEKFARLADDSNPSAMEFTMSDKRYFNDTSFDLDRLRDDMEENFNHMAAYYHYLSLAENNYKKYIISGNDRTYNRQFYVLRATLMAKHIRVEGTFPKLNIWSFLGQTECLSDGERRIMERLAQRKENGQLGGAPNLVGQFFERESGEPMDPTDERTNNPSRELLNEFIEASVFNR